MSRKGNKNDSRKDPRRILLVGRADELSAAAEPQGMSLQVCENVLEAIPLAAEGGFDCIVVLISSLESRPVSSLKALRAVGKQTRIVLLAEMHQEPMALQLLRSDDGATRLADDYFIYPLAEGEFAQMVLGTGERTEQVRRLTELVHQKDAAIRQMARLATEDDLTGLRNRRYIREFLRQIIERAKVDNLKVTVLVFDIDDFKQYNDVYGHLTGDMILKQAAALMQRCCRSHDIVGRVGGDEFAVVFWDGPRGPGTGGTKVGQDRRSYAAEHPREAIFIAERFRKELGSAEFALLGPKGRGVLTISGGLASFPRDGSTAEQLLERADKALLKAKRSGKDCIYLVGKPAEDSTPLEG